MAPAELDQIGVLPINRVLASSIFPPSDMVVGMALESTGAKFHHVPTPDLPHLMLVEPMAWYALVAEGTVESHLCAY